MPQKYAYLDNSATTQVCAEAVRAAVDAMTAGFGNPSSLHAMGVCAERVLETARSEVASSMRCGPEEIVFTSGGTESNNTAVFGACRALRHSGRRIVTTAIEHPSVLEAAAALEQEGFEVVRLRPGADGKIAESDLYAAVNADTILVSMMAVNNETGAVQPVAAMKKAAARAGAPALIHCDAVQAFCRLPLDPKRLGFDLMSVSSHKIHGPKGSGALFIRQGVRIPPLMYGGGQEKKRRSGTEAVELAAGFGKAASIAWTGRENIYAGMTALRAACGSRLAALDGVVVNSPDDAVPYILSVSVPGVPSEVMLNFLSANGVYVSAGSACSRGARSHVLAAMNLPGARASSALRVSLSRFSTEEDIALFCDTLAEGIRRLRRPAKR